jgi:hypothetical protein
MDTSSLKMEERKEEFNTSEKTWNSHNYFVSEKNCNKGDGAKVESLPGMQEVMKSEVNEEEGLIRWSSSLFL